MSQSMSACRAVGLAVTALACTFLLPTVAVAAASSECPVPANQPAAQPAVPGESIDPPITLNVVEPNPTTEVVNFGNGRGEKSFTVVLKPSRTLPGTFNANQLELNSLNRPKRVSSSLESASLPPLSFSEPRVYAGGERISFQTCVNASGAKPGSYTGQVLVAGPSGLVGTTVGVTANAKSLPKFLVITGLALLLAFGLLLVRAANEKKGKGDLFPAIPPRLSEGNFWGPTVIGLGASLAAMISAYTKDPAWGADSWASFIALFGAAFGATGLGSFVASYLKGSSSEDPVDPADVPDPDPDPVG